MKKIFPGVWKGEKSIYTKNLVPGEKAFTRKTIIVDGKEYREWDPKRSKACAAIVNGIKTFPIKEGSKILYLGIASGSTASFFSDITGHQGIIYGIEISERSIRELNPVAERRGNIVPILSSARKPLDYKWIEKVDVIYQDVATDDQSEIITRNSQWFLKEDGFALIGIKSRSIDVTKAPDHVYRSERKKLNKNFEIIEGVKLDPYERDHLFLVMKPRKSLFMS
jgi:fibrillarin-like pre-rRNA processing protein